MEMESSEKRQEDDIVRACESARKPYLPPLLTVYGSLLELTREEPIQTPEFDQFFAGTMTAS